MCGIAGIASSLPNKNQNWLDLASKKLIHRGPDGSGVWWSSDKCIGLAHRRLAVIDLSDLGQQPMADSTNQLHVVFNGEIYNYIELKQELIKSGHHFRTTSDTEVLLYAYKQWGEGFISRLNGMFAFAIHDNEKKKLILVRDRVGEKPLYYWTRNGSISFASELKALMLDPKLERRIDPRSFNCYLGLGFVPGDSSIICDVRKLPPAHSLLFDLSDGSISLSRYWSPPSLEISAQECSEEDLIIELEDLLQQAVKSQLVADVPVGVLLSGGLDSSIVTAIAARVESKIKTFTVRFPGGGKHDESQFASRVANYLGTDHLTLDAESSSIDLLPTLARQYDEPLNDSSMVPTYLVSRLIKQHCTVAIGGDGGDELFGGYTHYDRMLRLQNYFGRVPRPLRHFTALLGRKILPVGFKGSNWLQALDVDFIREVPLIASYFDRLSRELLLGTSSRAAEKFWMKSMPRMGDLIERATRMDFENYLPEDILVKVDRASMLTSLEVRAPMLDKNILEFSFQKVPSKFKTTSTERKILLRSLAKKLLPPDFDVSRKQGFSIPISNWLETGVWLNFFKEVLFDRGQVIFCHRFIEKLFHGQAAGRSNGERLFGLVMFELWRREYQISI